MPRSKESITKTDDFERSCFKCTNKAFKIMLGVWECLGENLGKYIELEESPKLTCPGWEKIQLNSEKD